MLLFDIVEYFSYCFLTEETIMNKITQVLEEIFDLEYTSNANNAHENQIKQIIEKHGFLEIDLNKWNTFCKKDGKIKARDKLLKGKCYTFGDGYIHQPCGSQDSPDFIIFENGNVYMIECKSTNDGDVPVYNGGLPKEKYIYVYTSNKHNSTTIYLGSDIVPEKARIKFLELAKQHKALDDKFNEKNPGTLGHYTRAMYNHNKKDPSFVNYFDKKEKKKRKQNVMDFIKGLSDKPLVENFDETPSTVLFDNWGNAGMIL